MHIAKHNKKKQEFEKKDQFFSSKEDDFVCIMEKPTRKIKNLK